MIDREAGISLWRQIENRLRQEISSGTYGPGDRLPTEHALAKRFNVNRHTVRRGVSALVDKGLVRVDQGRGTFVQENIIDYVVRKRTRFTENILSQRRSTSGTLIFQETRPAEAAIAKHLDLPPGASVILLRLLRTVDERPVSLSDHYFSARRFAGLVASYMETNSLSDSLARLGVPDYTRKVTRVIAKIPTSDEARKLAQPVTRPILVTEGINIDSDGRPIEFGLTRFSGERVQLLFES